MKDIFKNKLKIEKAYQEQLRRPIGPEGKIVGQHLYDGNAEVIEKTIAQIDKSGELTIIDI